MTKKKQYQVPECDVYMLTEEKMIANSLIYIDPEREGDPDRPNP